MPEPRTHVKLAGPAVADAVRIFRGGAFVADDPWQTVGDDAPLPPDAPALVSLKRWTADRDALVAHAAGVGLALAPTELPDAQDIGQLRLITLELPKFTDGRAYSTARRLRERGFSGELRATGDVLLDQVPLLARCGFDSFAIRHLPTIRALEAGALSGLSHAYQPSSRDTLPLVGRVRLRRAG